MRFDSKPDLPLLQVQDLHIQLHSKKSLLHAVSGVYFDLKRGQTLGLVGESGCGKSLTALALMGLLPNKAQMQGSILFKGQELSGLHESAWCKLRGDRISMIFQEPSTALNPLHSIGRQVAEPLQIHPNLSANQAKEQALHLLKRVGIHRADERFDAYPHQFSGGERQRIMIAMALACEPDILIADEPTTALDVTIQQQILDLLQELARERNMALLLISHNLGLVAKNAHHILVMYGGRVMESGTTKEVFENPLHPYTKGLLAAQAKLGVIQRRLTTIEGNVPHLSDLPKTCPFAKRCPKAQERCFTEKPNTVFANNIEHQASCLLLS